MRFAPADVSRPAGLVSRLLAAAVDAIVIVACLAAMRLGMEALGGIAIGELPRFRAIWRAVWTATHVGFIPVYHVASWTLAGATIGKWILGLRVVGPDGRSPRLLRALVRFAAYTISIAPLLAGFIAIAFNVRRLAWHDRVARTAVVHVHEETAPSLKVRIHPAGGR
jgi:uncharacterized RDD family membrane protein YckC